MNGFKISNWLWVFYPIVVVVFMGLGFNFMMSSGQNSIISLVSRQEETKAFELKLEVLKSKLEKLKLVDEEVVKADLVTLTNAVPSSRTVWLLINELNEAGKRANMKLESYKGTVGEVLEASESAKVSEATPSAELNTALTLTVDYGVTTIDDLVTGLTELERMLPLIKINQINYSSGTNSQTKMIIEGAWSGWGETSNDPAEPLPTYENNLRRAFNNIKDKELVSLSLE